MQADLVQLPLPRPPRRLARRGWDAFIAWLRDEVDPPPHRLLPPRKRHWQMLTVAAFVLIMSFALDVLPDGHQVALHGLHRFPLPETCMARAWSGHDCPGCGLTCSIICLADGDWSGSLRMHRLGWLMAAAIAFQVPYRIISLHRPDRPLLPRPLPQLFGWGVIVALMVNWFVQLVV